jgi:spore coat polysaccharide biosynthesis protein SpsF
MFKTEQEKFWAENFGENYIERNQGEQLLASNLNFFSNALSKAGVINSCLEFGANIGMNLMALKLLYPSMKLEGIEINETASKKLCELIGQENVFNKSIFDFNITSQVELSLIRGVLIHINPEMLQLVYKKLYDATTKYILICEYYNPTPITIPYRGFDDKLFKRDFAGEFLDKFKNTELVDYGFAYKRDPAFPQDDITWFLIKKDL